MQIPLIGKLSFRKINATGAFLFPLFLVVLADSIITFNFPIIVQETVNSNLIVGIVMAISSFVAIICDFIFPALLKEKTWRFQLTAGILLACTMPFMMYLGHIYAIFWLFLLASVIWGIYYEFFNFAQQNFVIKEERKENFTRYWGIIFVVVQVTGIIGPIMGSLLLKQYDHYSYIVIFALQLLALIASLIVLWFYPKRPARAVRSGLRETFQIIHEMKYWGVFVRKLLPIIIMGISLEFIEATFWTLGGLFGQSLSSSVDLDYLPILLYSIPFIIGALILAKLNISQHKKKISQLALLGGATALIPLFAFPDNLAFIAGSILISSLFLSFAGPLNEAVFSDLIERSKDKGQSLLGLDKANSSIAYVIAPILMGFLADAHGYYFVFSAMGVAGVLIAIFLLFITPKKLKVPHMALRKIVDS